MYRKNTASQFVCFQMLLTATGAVATGLSPAVRRCIDGTFAAGGGTVTEDSAGFYKYAMAQADTNGNDISLMFSAATAMPVCINFVTTAADPTDTVRFGLTAMPNVASGSAGALIVSGTGTAALSVSSGLVTLAGVTHTGAVIPTVTTVTNQLTAAQIATGVWQDTTAGDFTTALSVGKSVMNGVALGTGLTVAAVSGAVGSVTGAVASVTGNVGGNVTGSVGSVTGLTASNLDATISSRMATYTQPTGFLAATFPTTVASPTNITAGTITTTTNLTTNNDKTGYALTSGERDSVADALLDRTAGVETSWTLRQAMRVMLSVLAGKASGLATTTAVYRDMADSKNRISATVDSSGNRTAVTRDSS